MTMTAVWVDDVNSSSNDSTYRRRVDDTPTSPRKREPESRRHRDRSGSPANDRPRYRDEQNSRFP